MDRVRDPPDLKMTNLLKDDWVFPMFLIGNLPKLRDVGRQVEGLAGLPVALAVRLDLVHHRDRDLLREDEDLGHVVIVIHRLFIIQQIDSKL